MAWDLSHPSSIRMPVPSWDGGVQYIGGWYDTIANDVYRFDKAIVDPAAKAAKDVQASAVTAVEGGYSLASTTASKVGSAVASPFKAAWSGLTSGVGTLFSSLTSGLKWGVIIIMVGLALYVFLLAAPFLPKPSQGGR